MDKQKSRHGKGRTDLTPPRRSPHPPPEPSAEHFPEDTDMIGQYSSCFSDSDSSSDEDGELIDMDYDDDDCGIVFCDEDDGAAENVQFDEEDTAVFTGYSGSAGESLYQVSSPSSLRDLVGEGSFQCYQERQMRQESSELLDVMTGDAEHDELTGKLRNTIEVTGC